MMLCRELARQAPVNRCGAPLAHSQGLRHGSDSTRWLADGRSTSDGEEQSIRSERIGQAVVGTAWPSLATT